MFINTATITTDRASTYLQQLCKHFGHKVEVRFDPENGRITFPFGHCDLTAVDGDLDMTISAETQADLTKTARIIASHLERFAFRENPKFKWRTRPNPRNDKPPNDPNLKLEKTMTLKTLIASAALATMATGTLADNTSAVKVFYDLLSNPGSQELAADFQEATSADWVSVGDYSGKNKTREAFLGQMGGFAKLIPDLNWDIQDMHNDGDTVVVRSRATGTPVAPFFGVDGQGRSFDIMTIDIHELENGKITHTYHIEDWAGALQQLSGK